MTSGSVRRTSLGQARRQAHRIVCGSHDPEHVRCGGADVVDMYLRIGEIQIPRRLSVECHLLHVADDPDDLDWAWRSVIVIDEQVRADRFEAVQPLASQLLVHNRYRTGLFSVILRECASASQRNACRLEVARRHAAKLRDWHPFPFDGPPLHRKGNPRRQSAQGKNRDCAGIRHGGQ